MSRELLFPNPTTLDVNGQIFEEFLVKQNICPSSSPAINAYQNCQTGSYLGANELNHCLNLEHYSELSDYAELADDQYGSSLDDYSYLNSKTAIDLEFSSQGLMIHSNSILYKGIGNNVNYQYMDLANKSVGDNLFFPGYLSTTISLNVAKSFAKSRPVPIVLKGCKAIIPQIKTVLHSPSGEEPEQEVLLERALTFKVLEKRMVCQTLHIFLTLFGKKEDV